MLHILMCQTMMILGVLFLLLLHMYIYWKHVVDRSAIIPVFYKLLLPCCTFLVLVVDNLTLGERILCLLFFQFDVFGFHCNIFCRSF